MWLLPAVPPFGSIPPFSGDNPLHSTFALHTRNCWAVEASFIGGGSDFAFNTRICPVRGCYCEQNSVSKATSSSAECLSMVQQGIGHWPDFLLVLQGYWVTKRETPARALVGICFLHCPHPVLTSCLSGSMEIARGGTYCHASGEILRPWQDGQQRRRSSRMFSLIKNESVGIEDDQIPS